MNYTVKRSQQGITQGVVRFDGLSIPMDPMNRDWREFVEWNKTAATPLDLSNGPYTPIRKARPLADIHADIAALLPAQQAKIWNDVQLRLIAEYVQKNTAYLVKPVFDPTINVAGDQPG